MLGVIVGEDSFLWPGFVTALLLLPTAGSKLGMKWQGPFTITRALEDGLNYELGTGKTCKQPGWGGGGGSGGTAIYGLYRYVSL